MKVKSVLAMVCVAVAAGTMAGVDVQAECAAMRKELRAYYPDRFQGEGVKDPRQKASYEKIKAEVSSYCKANPKYDALDVRTACYRAMVKHFQPFLFKECPFYFEAGVNGGWSGNRPGRLVNEFCRKFYWEKKLVPNSAFELLSARNRESLALCCGPFCDDMHHVPPFRAVLAQGFGGIRADVAAALKTCPADDPKGRKELETALVGLDTLHELQLQFAAEAERMLAQSPNLPSEQSNNLRRIADAAKRCPWEPPRTFYEGLNTLWFIREMLGYVDGVNCFSLGRPDAYLIDLYRNEIAAGTLTKDEARLLVAKFLVTSDSHYDSRTLVDSYNDHELEMPMSLGGCDAKGAPLWNELTEMFLDAHLDCDCVFPKLHCRIASTSTEAYLRKLGSMLMKGHAVFTLLNDDRFVKQYEAEGFSPEDARSYVGVGCWNGYVDSAMDVDGANYLSMIKILEMTIHRDEKKIQACKLELEPLEKAKNFEELRDVYWGNFERFLKSVTDDYARYGASSAQIFPHPAYSMCLKGCIESRRDTNEGGSVSHPRIMTLGFIGNVVDSLLAIKSVCYDRKLATVQEFLDVVRANWKGPRGEELRRAALNSPYWGDGSAESTGLLAWFMRKSSAATEGKDNGFGDKFRYAIYTYREFMYWGANTKATPDGRHSGDRLAQGFSPSEFRCEEGVTTVMNAIGELPHECLYASNVNLTFDASAMNEQLLAAILRVFAEKGSHMIQPNCNSVEQLLDAQKHPENYRHLIVRVCGFSARFTSLSKRWQDEVIARHRLK